MSFSIIVPVYNVAPYLRECLDSIAAAIEQYYSCSSASGVSEVEVICVDDGSADGSGAILDEYARTRENQVGEGDWRIKVIHQSNAGVSAARNIGLDVAKGDWIVFVDSDDVIAKNYLTLAARVIKTHPNADIVRLDLQTFEDGCSPEWIEADDDFEVIDISKSVPAKVLNVWFFVCVCRKSLIGDVRFDAIKNGEDVVFLYKMFSRAQSVACLNQKLYGYRQRANSASHKKKDSNFIGSILKYITSVYDIMDASGKDFEYTNRRQFANEATETMMYHISGLPRSDRDEMFRKAIKAWEHLTKSPNLPPRQRLRLRIFFAMPFRGFARLLFEAMYRLKVAGVHR